ncbi:type I-E CRISPR-associated protein Cas5/CasD [Anaeromyxobacter sp. PSR-1]|uniref:type I-E CRISPR-associated protein Cas5/CasD n=1 Tax=unclassified Anaeromyxobacter TaxID=2620896 RepID=UPI0005DEE82B|nr:type I-E CRISPR-associated protein Cas5/CasD [Anaeromyxobacter sp. PSR-1]GAO03221.1 CRISPR system Cascade subunit CasD [Anaeromyxobacter sp. PSR-1]
MASFLCFRLHGPLASWGDIAVGERRPSTPHPSRSAVLGLLAAALRIRRDDADALAALDRGLGFASRTDAPGELLIDFHTAQGPEEKLLRAEAAVAKKAGRPWHRPATRRAELAFGRRALSTLLSSRQYRVDAVWTVALWSHSGTPSPPLEPLQDALRRPGFVPYLGRKSCPLDLPLEPQIVEAAHPVEAMARAVFRSDAVVAPVLERGLGKGTVQWEEDWPGLEPAQTSRRRDRVISRSRWQFTERQEHQRAWTPEERGRHVPEQD